MQPAIIKCHLRPLDNNFDRNKQRHPNNTLINYQQCKKHPQLIIENNQSSTLENTPSMRGSTTLKPGLL